MLIFKCKNQLQSYIEALKIAGDTIGFVPTMGALHNGHVSLILNAKKENNVTICSIFVNPTQFNNKQDFEKYPLTVANDIEILNKINCDVLFLPTVDEIYPNGIIDLPRFNLGDLDTILEGKYREGHYQGVCQVVHTLLKLVQPNNLYLGQKDYQQCLVIKKMIALTHFNLNVKICATQREQNGLAMSSRNLRLNETEKIKAAKIYETLLFIKNEIKFGYVLDLQDRAIEYLSTEGFKVDYVAIANAKNLNQIENWDGNEKIIALIAAYINEVRLIDNIFIN